MERRNLILIIIGFLLMIIGAILKHSSPAVLGEILTPAGLFVAIWAVISDAARGREILAVLGRVEGTLDRMEEILERMRGSLERMEGLLGRERRAQRGRT